MRIVIEPCFAEGHFLEAHIRNTCEFLEPDHFIICEGLFPTGPEDSLSSERMEEFKKLYTTDGKRSFDIEQMREIIAICQKDYPGIDLRMFEMDYNPRQNTEQTYYEVYTFPRTILPLEPDDILIPHETDMFFTEEEANRLLEYAETMSPGTGAGIGAKTFFESPLVCGHQRGRRGIFKYGDGKFYDKFFRSYYWLEGRPDLQKTLIEYLPVGWHYEWIRPEPYFQMRLVQTFKHGVSHFITQARDAIQREDFEALAKIPHLNIWHKTDLKIEDHPPHIRNHPHFRKYYGESVPSQPT